MKDFLQKCFAVFVTSLSFYSCTAVKEIFEAGFYSGIFLVVFVIGLILFVVARLSKKK